MLFSGRDLIRFRLPNTKKPEEWLRKIARESNFKATYHKGRFLYSCGKECDLLRLEYLPQEQIYEAEWGYD